MNTKFETNILKNGLVFKSLRNEHLHSVNIGIYARKIPESICGIAHLTEHMFFRRLADIPQRQLYFEIDKIGATLKGVTYSDFICLDITVAPQNVKAAFDIISRAFCDFKWQTDEVNAEKQVVKRQIEERYNSAYLKTDMEYYFGTPKGKPIMGNISDVNKISTKALNEYRRRVFSPNNCCVVMTGNFSDNDLIYCTDVLSKLAQTSKEKLPEYSIENFGNRDKGSDKIYKSNDGYSDVCISFDVDEMSQNRYAAEILYSIVGFGVTSKLSQVLRESLGLITDIGGNIEFTYGSGRMTFEFDVKNENLVQSLTAVFEVISRAKYDLTDNDLQSNITFYTDNQYRLLDDVRELNFLIGWRGFIENENIDSIDDLSKCYSDITVNDIKTAAQKIFEAKNLTITVSNDNKLLGTGKLAEIFEKVRKEL